MDQPFRRLLIQENLADGRLPRAAIPRVWGGPGHGEMCDGCGEIVTNAQMVMENLDEAGGGSPVARRMLSRLGRRASGSGTRAERPCSGPIRVPELPAPVRAGPGHQPRRRPGRVARVTVTPESASTTSYAGPVRAGSAPRPAFRGAFVAVPPARNPRSDVPVLPQSRRRRTGSGHGQRDGDSVRLPLPHVRHGIRPRLLDAADDRDGLEHARRSLSAARHVRHPAGSLTVLTVPGLRWRSAVGSLGVRGSLCTSCHWVPEEAARPTQVGTSR